MTSGSRKKIAVIIGAGPAGLTVAHELIKRTDIKPIVIESSDRIGGLACTINYKGNRIDIGGHRFFSKSDRVMDWWLDVMPMQKIENGQYAITYHRATRMVDGKDTGPEVNSTDRVMLVRPRKSRIYFMRKFFDYPIKLSAQTLSNLGPIRSVKVGLSFLKSSFYQIQPERSLADFFTNRFGRELYLTFFKSYTEKVWGIPCTEISPEWGAQRVKGLSLWKALYHYARTILGSTFDIKQKNVETSLIERFLYPKLGPGQLWEYVAKEIQAGGGEVILNVRATGIEVNGKQVTAVDAVDDQTGEAKRFEGDCFISSMPVKDLMRALKTEIPKDVKTIGEGLLYRDFVTVGLLVNKLTISEPGRKILEGDTNVSISDNWIYIQEPDVMLGRLQIFNNWSPYMVADRSKVWLGLEYFCNESDDIWLKSEAEVVAFAGQELEKIGIIKASDIVDSTVIKMPKTYPGYFGTYDQFDTLREWIDQFENLYLIGRNGMHKYNNQDHAMLTAMTVVDNLLAGYKLKDNIWAINTEDEYHEEKS